MGEDKSSRFLSGQQRAMHEALAKEDARLAGYYLAALCALRDQDNPDPLAQAAHELRELMEKLPRYKNLPMEGKGATLTQKVRAFQLDWQRVSNASRCRTNSGWKGEIDEALGAFLAKVEEFL